MSLKYDYITSFIQRMENSPPTYAPICKGYVPMRNGEALGRSGVTIGTGVDLGQQTAKGLAVMGVPASLIGVLIPYLGLQMQTAIDKLKSIPLVLSPDATLTLDRAVIRAYIEATARHFDHIAHDVSYSSESRLEQRPKQVQAVVVSLEYQLGAKGAINFITPIAQGHYSYAVDLLKSAKAYAHRRRAESSLLMEVAHAHRSYR